MAIDRNDALRRLEHARTLLESFAGFGCEGDYLDGSCLDCADTPADWCGRCVASDAASNIAKAEEELTAGSQ